MLTLAFLLLLGIGLIALLIRPAQDADPAPVGYNPVQGETRRFLVAYVLALVIRFGRLIRTVSKQAQIPLLQIRQALLSMHFGRGLLHG